MGKEGLLGPRGCRLAKVTHGSWALEFARPSPGNTGWRTSLSSEQEVLLSHSSKLFNFTKDETQEGLYH